VVTGPAGEVFVGGESFGPVVLRLDPVTGDRIWRSEFLAGSGQYSDLALDPARDVVAAGSFLPFGASQFRFFVYKIAGDDGAEMWRYVSDFDSPELRSTAQAVATDPAGDVFAVGFSGPTRLVVVRLSGATGGEIWRYTLVSCSSTFSRDIAVDVEGNVFVAGRACLCSPLDAAFTVLKLSGSDGTEIWRHSVQCFDRGSASALALDAGGDVIATGTVLNLTTFDDLLAVKLSSADGSELWRRDVDGGGNGYDFGSDVALDPGGDAVVAGGLRGPTGNPNFAVLKLSGVDGSELWRSVSGEARALAIFGDGVRAAVGGGGDVVAAGSLTSSDSGDDLAVVRLRGSDGLELWQRTISGTRDLSFDYVRDVALDPLGDVVGVGSMASLCSGGSRAHTFKLSGADGTGAGLVEPCPIQGRRLLFRDPVGRPEERRLAVRLKDPDPSHWSWLPDDGDPVRPDLHGGTLELFNPGSGERASVDLPPENWQWLRKRYAWRYVDTYGSDGPCRKVLLGVDTDRVPGPLGFETRRHRILQAVCRGPQIGFSLDEPSQGRMGVRLTLGDRVKVRFCGEFGGTIVEDRAAAPGVAGRFEATGAPAPSTCPDP
jgi:outer membrane protein assembly factor BamB